MRDLGGADRPNAFTASFTGSPLARTSEIMARDTRTRTLGAISSSSSAGWVALVTLPIRPPVVTIVSPRRTALTSA